MKISTVFVLAMTTLSLQACGNNQPANAEKNNPKETTIHYSAAASLKDALTDIQGIYQEEHPTVRVELDFGGSGAIRQKVSAGSPIDGVLLASQRDTDKLVEEQKLEDTQLLLENKLVLIKNKQSELVQVEDLTKQLEAAKKIAVGEPETVPAGKYAVETLQSLKLFERVQSKLVMASDVRQVLSYVEAGNVDLGFVYETDAKLSDRVKILQSVPDELHAPIVYNTGVVSNSKNQRSTKAFNKFLTTAEAKEIFEKYGFTIAK